MTGASMCAGSTQPSAATTLRSRTCLGASTRRAGYVVGDLAVWGELLELRYQIVHAWIKHAIAHGRPLPSANPEAWPD